MNPAEPNTDPNAIPPVQPDAPAPQPTPAPEYQQPLAPTPEVAAPVPVAEPTPTPAPVFDQSPAAPTAYETPVAQPVAPAQVQPAGPVIGSGPEVPGAAPLAVKKNNNKLFILIGAIVGGLVLVGGAIFLIFSLLGNNLPLKEYQGDDYSILVPETYVETIEGPTAQFSLYPIDDEATKDKNSIVLVSGMEFNEFLTKEAWLKLVDQNFTKEELEEAGSKSEEDGVTKGYTYANVVISKDKISDSETRSYKADVSKDGNVVGTVYSGYVFGDKKMYIVAVLAREDSPGFLANAEKIFTSFKIK